MPDVMSEDIQALMEMLENIEESVAAFMIEEEMCRRAFRGFKLEKR